MGGSGGFYTGMQYAYQAGADWIWCMDDDVFPLADCLERLLQHAGREDIGKSRLGLQPFGSSVRTAIIDNYN